MSVKKVIICDRCGAVTEEDYANGLTEDTFPYIIANGGSFGLYKRDGIKLNICSDCYKKFVKWMRDGKFYRVEEFGVQTSGQEGEENGNSSDM